MASNRIVAQTPVLIAMTALVSVLTASGAPVVKTAQELFESDLKKRGVAFERSPGEELLYRVDVKGVRVEVFLGNIARDHLRDHDDTAVTRFVDRVLEPKATAKSWSKAKSHVYWSLEPSGHNLRDIVDERVTDTVVRVLVRGGVDGPEPQRREGAGRGLWPHVGPGPFRRTTVRCEHPGGYH